MKSPPNNKIFTVVSRKFMWFMDHYASFGENSRMSDFVKIDHQILDFWKKSRIFQKSLDKTAKGKPYIFYDGPPFATGLPHFGHLVASTIKDIVPRYFTMRGFHVDRRFGWDCHGLPVEYEIDKKLGMSAHDAVNKLGVKGYNDECRSIVQRFTGEWEKTITRLGRWVDFERNYKTMDTPFMESVWWAFKQLWEKGLIYQGTKVVPFSTALGTGLSNFEANQNYQEVQDPSVTVLFKLMDAEKYLAVWTTTPWTLPSNLGICVKASLEYVEVIDEELQKSIILAESRLLEYQKRHKLKIVGRFKGSDFQGKKYEPLFPYFKDLDSEGGFQIFCDDFVTTDTGTGIVHMAPAFGEEDHRIFQENHIPILVCPVDDAGKFTEEVSDYHGQYVKEADKNILHDLKVAGKLYQQETINHSYPFCWRSDTPLIYKAIPTWYVKVEAIKDRMIAANQKTNWVPAHIKEGRFGKWLENARDWAISRNRVWGTPLPIWQNEVSGNCLCVGSIEELEKLGGVKVKDLHREHVDTITFRVLGERGLYRRVVGVLDCWFESGAMPYAQMHYPFENKKAFEAGFPAAFIAEGLDQTRGWFYTLMVLSTALFDKPAFRNVIVNGIVKARDGKKMSKRLKNYTEPDSLMEEFGADSLRLYMIHSGLVRAEELKFDDEGVKDMVRRVLLPWQNAFSFFRTYSEIDGWSPKKHQQKSKNILDRWILSKLQSLIHSVNKEMESYQLFNVVPPLFTFIEDLTNTYIRMNRRRFWAEGLEKDKQAAYTTLYTVLKGLSLVMAPFSPFLSEYIFLELKEMGEIEEESVHLCTYPAANTRLIVEDLETAVARMEQILILGRHARNEAKIKIKTPLQKLKIIHKDKKLLKEISKLETYILSELNVKEVVYETEEDQYIRLFAKPNFPVLGKRFGKEMKKIKAAVEALDSATLAAFEENGNLTVEGEKLTGDDVEVLREAREGSHAFSNRWITIELDTTLTDDLIQEGLARDIVSHIQRLRKEKGLHVADHIFVEYEGDKTLMNAMTKYEEYVMSETLSQKISHQSIASGESIDIDGKKLTVSISRI